MAKESKPSETEAPAEPSINGILVAVGDEGGLDVQVLGETKATEIPTLLRIAVANVEKQFKIA